MTLRSLPWARLARKTAPGLAWVWVAGALALYLWQFTPLVQAILRSLGF